MPYTSALAAPLLLTGLLVADPPVIPPPPPALPGLPAFPMPATPPDLVGQPESLIFAERLVMLCDQVAAMYVRPVSRVDLACAALAGLYQAAGLTPPDDLPGRLRRAGDLNLIDAVRRVREEIGDPPRLRGHDPLLLCCRSVAGSLDPYTEVVTAEEQRKLVGLEQEGGGVGVELRGWVEGGTLVLSSVLPGGPAQRAGLKPGDRVERIEEVPACRGSQEKQVEWLTRGPDEELLPCRPAEPSRLRLTCRRGDAVRTVELERRRFPVETVQGVSRQDDHCWDYVVDAEHGIAQVRVTSLSRGTAAELRRVMTRLQNDGVRGVVLDLRWCPGGFLDEATDAACVFLSDALVATLHSREGSKEVRTTGTAACPTLPLVVLVNGDTSGGAELIAAALQDQGRAAVVGQRTRGKASVQTPLHVVGPGVGLKLTTGTFRRPGGKELHRFPDSKPGDDWGVRPDVECRLSPELSRALREDWLAVALRPGPSRERLTLDDPEADPQRQAAVRELLRRVDGHAQ